MNRRTFFASLFGIAAAPVAAPSDAAICKDLAKRAALTLARIHAEHVSFVLETRYLREDAYRLIRGRDGRDFKPKPSSYSDGFKVT